METFCGSIVHTGAWDPDVDLIDKDIVVIGNGPSATQLIPAISPKARHITQFMRVRVIHYDLSNQSFLLTSLHWKTSQSYFPTPNVKFGPLLQYMFSRFPVLHRTLRSIIFYSLEATFPQFHLSMIGTLMRAFATTFNKFYITKVSPCKSFENLTTNSS
jgi:hypothetical protein